MKNTPTTTKGFIALMSAIIISAVLLLLSVSGSFTGLYTRFNALDSELKERSRASAEACVDFAALMLGSDSAFMGNATTTLSETDSCHVGFIKTQNGQKTFKTQAIFNNAYTNLLVVLNAETLELVALEEIPNF